MTLTHVDFFSGLGSWAIAAQNNGLKTIALCEREEWLALGLEKIWGVPCYRDINDFPSKDYANRVWLLTGSPPCQPASRAGKQGGAGDVRWLWPETIRHTEIIKPAWFCYENPPGIADVGLDGIITDLEGIGYEVQLLRIPACAVDSPQDRDRFWILGHRRSIAPGARGPGRSKEREEIIIPITNGALGHRAEPGREGGDAAVQQGRLVGAAEPAQNSAMGNSIGTGWEPGIPDRKDARSAKNGAVANSQSESGGGDEPRRGPEGRIAVGRDAEGVVVAGGEVRGQSMCRSAQGQCGLGLQQPESDLLADCESDARRPRLCEGEPGGGGQLGQPSNRAWKDYQWIACPDRDGAVKVRRAPTGLYELAHGVSSRIPRKFHSKMIAALGNAIVWQVADQIIKAIMANA